MALDKLLQSLSERWMPEYVVKAILDDEKLRENMTAKEKATLQRALPAWANTSMPQTFVKVVGMEKQVKTASELFPDVKAPRVLTARSVRMYVNRLKETLKVDGVDFKGDRLTHKQRRRSLKPFSGHRSYNKRFRLLTRMEEKFEKWQDVSEIRLLGQIAKSRLASEIDTTTVKDQDTAAFLAYMTAKLNKRSMFTFGRQERPYDNIANMLFKRLGPGTNWLAVAYVHPAPEVLDRLTGEQKGKLLGKWYSIMKRAARILATEVKGGGIDLKSLIVRRGNDSSTWNEAAGAFNKAREGWINTLYALGMESVLDSFAPGKALRLMAADVAYGHRAYGNGLEPDTIVWNNLPKPWETVLNGVKCDRATIELVCKNAGVQGKGWIAPRPKNVAAYKSTPELVHGVVVSCPTLAKQLKDAGYFAGISKGPATGFVNIKKQMNDLTVNVSSGADDLYDQDQDYDDYCDDYRD